MTREEAIKIISQMIKDEEGFLSDNTVKAHKMAIKALEQEPRWIPVSERLPEVMDGTNGECSDDVLICVADGEHITISTGFYGYYPKSKSSQGWWSMWAYGCVQLGSEYKVVAWMPLPKPYLPDTNIGNMSRGKV